MKPEELHVITEFTSWQMSICIFIQYIYIYIIYSSHIVVLLMVLRYGNLML